MSETRLLEPLERRWRLVVVLTALALIAALGTTALTPPLYETTATLALVPATISIPTTNQLPPYYLSVDAPRRLPPAFTPAYYIAHLNDAELVAQVAPRARVSIAVNASDRALIEITARGDDAKSVADTANAWARRGAERITDLLAPNGDDANAAQKKLDAAEQTLVKFARDNNLGEYDPVKLQTAPGLATDKRLELARLMREREIAETVYRELARDFQTSVILAQTAYKPRVIVAPTPTAPLAPKFAQNGLVGALFGLLIGVIGAFAFEFLKIGNAKK